MADELTLNVFAHFGEEPTVSKISPSGSKMVGETAVSEGAVIVLMVAVVATVDD